MRTSAELSAAGFVRIHRRSIARSSADRFATIELWANPESREFVRVFCEPFAVANAGRGHWTFNPLAAWCRWHFQGGSHE